MVGASTRQRGLFWFTYLANLSLSRCPLQSGRMRVYSHVRRRPATTLIGLVVSRSAGGPRTWPRSLSVCGLLGVISSSWTNDDRLASERDRDRQPTTVTPQQRPYDGTDRRFENGPVYDRRSLIIGCIGRETLRTRVRLYEDVCICMYVHSEP